MVYSVNLTQHFGEDAFSEDINFYHLAICSTLEKAIEVRKQAIREFTKDDTFDGCTFDENGNLLTEINNPRYDIEVGGPIGSDVDDFAMWCIMDNTTDDWLEVVIKPMEIDKGICL